MKKYQISIDSYELIYVQGFPEYIKCLVYVKGIFGESEERKVNAEDFAHFIGEEDIEEYFNEESIFTISADLETYINKMEGRKEKFPTEELEFPESLLN